MMRQIYSNAESVSIWLGEEDVSADSNEAMNFFTRRDSLDPNKDPSLELLRNEGKAQAVLALCQRPYWARIWIVQELLLGKEMIIYCGSKALPWHHIQIFFNQLHAAARVPDRLPFRNAIHYYNLPASKVAKAKATWNGQQSLLRLLQLCWSHQASDILDKMYAVHGLANDTGNLSIDYDIDAEQLFEVVLEHICVQNSREEIGAIRGLLNAVFGNGYDHRELGLMMRWLADERLVGS